jgi:hypothetical protein
MAFLDMAKRKVNSEIGRQSTAVAKYPDHFSRPACRDDCDTDGFAPRNEVPDDCRPSTTFGLKRVEFCSVL